MRHFELVAILSPMLSPQESAAAWDDIKSFIANRDGEFTGEQRWGTRRLAYPIRKGNYNFLEGAYYLSSFTVENAFNRELETYLRLDDRVLRSLVMRCNGPLEDKPAPGPLTAPSRYIPPGRGPRRNDGGGPIPEGAGGFDRRGPRPPMGGPRGDGPPPGPRTDGPRVDGPPSGPGAGGPPPGPVGAGDVAPPVAPTPMPTISVPAPVAPPPAAPADDVPVSPPAPSVAPPAAPAPVDVIPATEPEPAPAVAPAPAPQPAAETPAPAPEPVSASEPAPAPAPTPAEPAAAEPAPANDTNEQAAS